MRNRTNFRRVDDKAQGHAVGSRHHDVRSPRLDVYLPHLHLAGTSYVDKCKCLDDTFWLVDDKGKGHALGSKRHDVSLPGHAFSLRCLGVRSRHDDVE
jgi:hypothetical protein